MRNRRVFSIQNELLTKSKEAAMNAAATFNNPLTTFKSETFTVLMVISWMYLLHAYYRGEGIDYRYYQTLPSGRKKYDKTKSGNKKYWELERCLNEKACPLEPAVSSNLRFLIGLRHEIEHQICLDLDDRLSGRYLAACLNYETALTTLFGPEHSLGQQLSFALQFRDLFRPVSDEPTTDLPASVAKYIQEFDASLPEEHFGSQAYSVRLLFTQKTANRLGQADRVVEFVPADSDLASAIEKQYWVLKEVDKQKYGAKQVVEMMKAEGYSKFTIYKHTQLWKRLDAKNPGKGFGNDSFIGMWGWYPRWVDRVKKECEEHPEIYGTASEAEPAA